MLVNWLILEECWKSKIVSSYFRIIRLLTVNLKYLHPFSIILN